MTGGGRMTEYKRKYLVRDKELAWSCLDFAKKCHKEHDIIPCHSENPYCPYPIGEPAEFLVAERMDGKWECNCDRNKYFKEECKHIRKAKTGKARKRISVDWTEETLHMLRRILR